MNAVLCLAAIFSLVDPTWGLTYSRDVWVPSTVARFSTCLDVADGAASAGVPVELALAFAAVETKFRADRIGGAGEIGPLQALPRYYCPDGIRDGCDALDAGLRALSARLDRWPDDWTEVAARYNGGNTPPARSRQIYAPRVVGLAESLLWLREALAEVELLRLRRPG